MKKWPNHGGAGFRVIASIFLLALTFILIFAGTVLADNDKGDEHNAKNFVVQDTFDPTDEELGFIPKSETNQDAVWFHDNHIIGKPVPLYVFITNNGQQQNVEAPNDIKFTITLVGLDGQPPVDPYLLTIPDGNTWGTINVTFPSDGRWEISVTSSIRDNGHDDYFNSNDYQIHVRPVPVSLAITPDTVTVPVGGTKQLTATMTYANGSSMDVSSYVTWQSGNQSVATVNSNGVAKGVNPGTTTITATDTVSGLSASAALNVEPLIGLTIEPSSASILINSSQVFKAILVYYDWWGHRYTMNVTNYSTWSSSNQDIATVSNYIPLIQSGGVATAKDSNGTTTITATFWLLRWLHLWFPQLVDVDATATLTVTGVTGITVTPSTATIQVGDTKQFTAVVNFYDNTSKPATTVTWTSSDPAVATVDTTGLATAAQVTGSAIITAFANGASGTAQLNVINKIPTQLTIAPTGLNLPVAGTRQYTATLHYSDGSTEDVTNSATWTSSDPAIATVGTPGVEGSTPGLATGVSYGEVTITAQASGLSGTITFKVVPDHLGFASNPVLQLRADFAGAAISTWGYIGEPMTVDVSLVAFDAQGNIIRNYVWDQGAFQQTAVWGMTPAGMSTTGFALTSDRLVVPVNNNFVSDDHNGTLRVQFGFNVRKDRDDEKITGFSITLNPNYTDANGISLRGPVQALVSGTANGLYDLYGGRIRVANEYFYQEIGTAYAYVERYDGGFVTNTLDQRPYDNTQWRLDSINISTPGFSFQSGRGTVYPVTRNSSITVATLTPVLEPSLNYLGIVPGTMTWGQIVPGNSTPGDNYEGPVWEYENIPKPNQ